MMAPCLSPWPQQQRVVNMVEGVPIGLLDNREYEEDELAGRCSDITDHLNAAGQFQAAPPRADRPLVPRLGLRPDQRSLSRGR